MSQALQCTQLEALICSFLPPAPSVDHFVDVRGAEVRARIAELLRAARGAERQVGDLKMHRLVLVVRGRGEEYERQPVARRQLALAPASIGRGVLVQALERLVVRVIGERPGELAEGDGLERPRWRAPTRARDEIRAGYCAPCKARVRPPTRASAGRSPRSCPSRRSGPRLSFPSGSPDECP